MRRVPGLPGIPFFRQAEKAVRHRRISDGEVARRSMPWPPFLLPSPKQLSRDFLHSSEGGHGGAETPSNYVSKRSCGFGSAASVSAHLLSSEYKSELMGGSALVTNLVF